MAPARISGIVSDLTLPETPDVSSLNPQMMTATELTSNLERLFGWLQTIEALPETVVEQHVDEETIQTVRDAANMLLLERRDRHSDEGAPRGG